MQNAWKAYEDSDKRAVWLLELEEEHAKREIARHGKEMEMLDLKIGYWK